MSDTVLPSGENLRRAVQWISARRQDEPPAPMTALLDEAALRFDLSPVDQEWLTKTFTSPLIEGPGGA